MIGKTVALNLVLGRSDTAALWIPALTASADGFEFDLELRHDLDEEEFGDPFFFGHRPGRRRRTSEGGLDPELLRFGIQFSDGRKATNIDTRIPSRTPGVDEPPGGLVLSPRGGGGGQGRWRQDFWVSPLPPAGPLAFVCEWPVAAIPETRNEVDWPSCATRRPKRFPSGPTRNPEIRQLDNLRYAGSRAHARASRTASRVASVRGHSGTLAHASVTTLDGLWVPLEGTVRE